MTREFDITVVGNVGIDTNIYFEQTEPDFSLESSLTENIDCVGQAGGYGCRGFAALGKKTALIGCVGDDFGGQWIRRELGADGVDLSAVFPDPMGTGRSVNFVYPDGRRKNFYDGKGHKTLKPNLDICRGVLQKSKLVHFDIPNWARDVLPLAKSLGLTISCDIQDVVLAEDAYRRDFVKCADILFFSSSNQSDPTELIKKYLHMNPAQTVIVGMGDRGCLAAMRQGIFQFAPVEMPEPVVDANGAGGALVAGFLSSYMLDGYTFEESILRGQIAARHASSQKASSAHLISAQALQSQFVQSSKNAKMPMIKPLL